MEFSKSIDLVSLRNNLSTKIDTIYELIESKEKELDKLKSFHKNLLKERSSYSNEISKIKKSNELKKEKEKAMKNTIPISSEEIEENSFAKIHYEEDLTKYLKEEYKDKYICELKDCSLFKENFANFGDIVDITGNRHYGYTFVGKDGKFVNSSRSHVVDNESGVTVPFDISKYLTDTVSKYKNLKYDESCIVAYELSYKDATVQKYKVKKNHMYEYVCWNEKTEQFDFDNWHLEQIDIETGKRTKPRKVRKKNV